MTSPRRRRLAPVSPAGGACLLAALLLTGCSGGDSGAAGTVKGHSSLSGTSPTSGGSSLATAAAAVSPGSAAAGTGARPTPSGPPVLVLADDNGDVHLVTVDGHELAAPDLGPGPYVVAQDGPRVLVTSQAGTALEELSRDGTVRQLGPLGTSGDQHVTGLVAAPDGRHWMWGVSRQNGGAIDSAVYLGGPGLSPRRVASRSDPNSVLEPVAWSEAGAVLAVAEVGIGGFILFQHFTGPTSLVNLTTLAQNPLTTSSCAFSDIADSGAVACVTGPQTGVAGAVTLHVDRPAGAAIQVPLPAGTTQAGNAVFRPDGAAVTVSSTTSNGGDDPGGTPVATELLDLGSGAARPVGPAGTEAELWLPDGRLVMARLSGFAGGAEGTYVVTPGGAATMVSGDATVLGVLL